MVAPGLAWAQQNAQGPEEYRIGPEDILIISVWKNQELSRSVPVRPDGMISLPLLNDVQAAGLTPMQLRDFLTKKLKDYLPSPEVAVIVGEVHSFKVSVIGEVQRADRFQVRSQATVLDALAMARGFKDFAATDRIVILRPDGKAMKRIPFNYKKVIAGGGEAENLFLQPGDIIVVP
jgi:polysaccharide export outer membrane protein